ncbi:MAG: T9SS type A sorting domain-containing protein [Lacibacter sp.]
MKTFKTLSILVFFVLISFRLSAQTFFGVSSSVIDNFLGGQAGPTVTVVPPALMQSGDLVVVYVHYSGTIGTITTGNTGGQSWNIGATATNGTNNRMAILWCRFNGTWSANPTFFTIGSGTNAMTALMYVYRPNSPSSQWGVHINETTTVNTGGAQSTAAFSTTLPRTVSMGFFGNASISTWGAVSGAGWVKPVFPTLATQLRNTATGTLSHSAAYNIQTAPASITSMSQTQSGTASTGRTYMTWFELTNDECSGAISLTSGGSCTNTAGSLAGATISAGIPAGCEASGSNTYDVWYQFTATSSNHTVQLSGYGTNFTRRQLVIYQGSCGVLTPIGCSSFSTSGAGAISTALNDLSPGITYYVRVIFNNTTATPITANGGFNICVTTGTNKSTPAVTTGKSYTNISRPNGGVIMTGDVLEFRATIGVGSWSTTGSIYNVTYHDTIPAGLSYVPNSIQLKTNEGLAYQSAITNSTILTDASGDDEAVVSGNVLRVHVPSLTRSSTGQSITQVGAATTPITYASAGGGKINHNGRPSQFRSFCIIVVTYRVTVTASTGSTFTTSNGQFRYKSTADPDDVTFPQTIINFPRYSAFVSTDASMCQSSVGINTYTGGDFGSGTTRHDSTQLTIAPGYTWSPFRAGNPGDGLFAVVNNTSSNGSTNKYISFPTTGTGADTARVFNVWDIIGDHTNAANQDSGNFAVPPGTNGGYMAVVNAAYGINTAVQKTITGLCSDTYYEFSAWFKNICAGCSSDSSGVQAVSGNPFKTYLPTKILNDSAGVSPDLTYTIDGVDYYTTGNVVYDKRWVKKGFLFRTGPSQTSVTLTIRNNAPGGGGNDWAIDDIGLATCLPRLTMRPSTTPTYCNNNQVTLSVAVSTFYNNYIYYFWERSTDGGATWSAIYGDASSPLTYTYTNFSGEYRDTVSLPSFVATTAMNGYKYRIRTATSQPNLSSSTCAVYNNTDVITIAVSSPCYILPAELLQFNVRLNGTKAVVSWISKEEGITGYEIERSYDGIQFTKAGFQPATGVNGENASYSFTDPVDVSGKVYYRLKLIKIAQSENKYSNILSVTTYADQKLEIINLVNPFQSRVTFQLNAFRNEDVQVQITDLLGRPLVNKKQYVTKGSNAIALDLPHQYANGSYILRVVSTSGTINRIIQKH